MKKNKNKYPQTIRYAPDISFPPYAYVPGIQYHPTHHPLGHSYKSVKPEVDAPDQETWRDNNQYLFGIDLFNYGFYWEAHEAWEEVWHACGHVGEVADFLKALIKLTAAGVKVREQKLNGVKVHATNANQIFLQLTKNHQGDIFLGLSLDELIQFSKELSENPFINGEDADFRKVIFSFSLTLQFD